MDPLFESNLQLLAKRAPHLVIGVEMTDCSHLQWGRSADGALNLSGYHCAESPSREAAAWFSGLKLATTDVLYVYGVGLGYAFEAARGWLEEKSERHLVFLEDELAVIRRLLSTDQATALLSHPRVQLHYLPHPDGSPEIFHWLGFYFLFAEPELAPSPAYARRKAQEAEALRQRLFYEAIDKGTLLSELLRFGAGYLLNFYANSLQLAGAHLAHDLFGKFTGVPAIICGAGPSLDCTLPSLRALDDKALLFGVGSSLAALHQQGVRPHFGVAVDPNASEQERLMRCQVFPTPCFYRSRLHHGALLPGPRLYVRGSSGYPITSWLEERLGIDGPILDEGNTAIHFAAELARMLGCNPIIFVGMDLAFTHGLHYAQGVVSGQSAVEAPGGPKERLHDGRCEVDDMHGRRVTTTWRWRSEARWISDYAQAHPEVQFFNATEGGQGFSGIENGALASVLGTRVPDLQSRVETATQRARTVQAPRERVQELLMEMDASLERSMALCNSILKELKRPDAPPTTLSEIALFDEIAYQYYLEYLALAHMRRVFRASENFRCTHPSPEQYLERKRHDRIELYTFLKEACDVHRTIIQVTL